MTGLPLATAFLTGFLAFFLPFLPFPFASSSCFFFFRGEFELGPAQHFGQVRANGLAFAVRIARQIDGIGGGGGFLQLRHNARFVRIDFIGRLKPVRDINAQHLLGQVHDVPVGGLDRVIAAQIFVDRLRFCGRFDDDQRSSHDFFPDLNARRGEAFFPFLSPSVALVPTVCQRLIDAPCVLLDSIGCGTFA